jgi:DNA replication protein DnaC
MTSFRAAAPTITGTELPAQLSQVGLLGLAEGLEDFLARATKARLSHRQLIEELVRLELSEGAKRSLERRLARSRLGRFKPIADFDWGWPKKIERDVLERALTLDFVQEGRNLILMGTNGLGKTMLAKNLGHQAAVAGYSVLFLTAAELIDDLRADVSHNTFRRKLYKYSSPHLLLIDEVGYLSYDSQAADLLYKVIDRRYERRSTLLTTNLAFREWNTVFPNATSIATLLDKLTHHADVTVIEGQSYRVHESQREAAARRKQK